MNEPSYWGILPASVRYAEIPAGAKLLYTEITALERAKGHCWATNAYFAELYKTHEKTISRWFSALEKGGHIEVVSQKDNNGWRIIRTVEQNRSTRVTEMLHPVEQNCYTPCNKNATHNNTSSNNTSKNSNTEAPLAPARFVKPTIEELRAYVQEQQMPIVEAERFMNYYEANGWRVGKNPMKCWRAAVRNWKGNWKSRRFQNQGSSPAMQKPEKSNWLMGNDELAMPEGK